MGTPGLSGTIAQAKDFWQKQEGTTAKWFIALLMLCGAGALFVFWGTVVPFVMVTLADTMWSCIYAGITAAMLFVCFNKKTRTVFRNIFQSVMRGITRIYATIDPIGILENTLEDQEKSKREMDGAVANVAGSKQHIQDSINKKQREIDQDLRLAMQAEKAIAATQDPDEKRQLNYKLINYKTDAGMKNGNLGNLNTLLTTISNMYSRLRELQDLADFTITKLRNEIGESKITRQSILDAYKGMSLAQKVLKGDPDQLQMFDASLEFLAEDNAKKVGYMNDFADSMKQYVTGMNLETGAAAADADKLMSDFKQKMLGTGTAPTVPVLMPNPQGVYVPVPAQNPNNSGYDPFK